MKPEISIILPVYNVEEYLDECIQSILNQTFKNYELIIINDGSTDDSGKICDGYAIKDKRIKVIHKENGGISSARNVGIKQSSGNFIVFIDSDDYIEANMLECLYEYITKYNTDMVICDFVYKCENNIINNEVNENKIKIYNSREAQAELYGNKYLNFAVAWSKIYRKSLFNDLYFDENRIHEDEFIAHKILNKCNKIIFIPNKLYVYRIRNNSITNSKYSLKRFDRVYAIEDRLKFYRELNLSELIPIVDCDYVYLFFTEYVKCKKELKNVEKELSDFKKDFKNTLRLILKSPIHSIDKKIFWIICYIYPNFYTYYNKL